MIKPFLIFLSTLLFLGCLTATAQEETGPVETEPVKTDHLERIEQGPVAPERGRFGVGFASVYPAPLFGLSLEAALGADISAEATIAPLGSLSAYSLKGKYTFSKEPNLRAYGFGTAALLPTSYDGESPRLSVGAGAGIELVPPYIAVTEGEAAPLWASLEVGLMSRGLYSDGISILFGSGLKFYF